MLRFLTSYARVAGFIIQCLIMMLRDFIYRHTVSPVLFLWQLFNFWYAVGILVFSRVGRSVVKKSPELLFALRASQEHAITVARALCALETHHEFVEGSLEEAGIVASCGPLAGDIVHYYCQIAHREERLPHLLSLLQHAERLGKLNEYARIIMQNMQKKFRLIDETFIQLIVDDRKKLPLCRQMFWEASRAGPYAPRLYIVDIIIARLKNKKYQAVNFKSLINRLLTEEVPQRGGELAINLRIRQVLLFFYTCPEHLYWADQIAADVLQGCVNQPLTGWLEICAWIEIAEQKDVRSMINATEALHALSLVKEFVLSSQEITNNYKPEAVCVLMREVCRKLRYQGHLTRDWIGLFDIVAHEFDNCSVAKYPLHEIFSRQTLARWRMDLMMRGNAGIFYQSLGSWLGNAKAQRCIADIAHKVTQMTDQTRLDTLISQSAGNHIWGRIAYRKEFEQYQNSRRKEILFSQKAVLSFLGDASKPDIEDELNQSGYSYQDFEEYLKGYCPQGDKATDAQKNEAYRKANDRRVELERDIDISLNDKVISWTRDSISIINQRHRAH